jgi:hypothetical protein
MVVNPLEHCAIAATVGNAIVIVFVKRSNDDTLDNCEGVAMVKDHGDADGLTALSRASRS